MPTNADDRHAVGNHQWTRRGNLLRESFGTAYACPDVSVRWLNLTTGATGTTALRRTPVDYSRPVAADEWCRYTPATAVTGSGTLTATADTDSVVAPGGFQVQVNPGFGTISVP
ncbi:MULTISPECIES: hypothetical protein [unclassified Rhodococcus (in: high G+C Gram-positive bacteria)]|uniref:hypothetical protein n=1 Tax=unclassified Rhodococcus (in: high G+C Gram-positive bacteria) TaxID=192944 RepID=UPI0020C6F1EC|nr:hypothetical protein [Rhodococcus sp. W8901]